MNKRRYLKDDMNEEIYEQIKEHSSTIKLLANDILELTNDLKYCDRVEDVENYIFDILGDMNIDTNEIKSLMNKIDGLYKKLQLKDW